MIYIKSPAIQFSLPPENDIHMVEEYCHQACYDYINGAYEIYAQTFPEKYNVIEGYTLTDGSFVDRIEAYKIADITGMLKDMYAGIDYKFARLESYMIKKYGGPDEN